MHPQRIRQATGLQGWIFKYGGGWGRGHITIGGGWWTSREPHWTSGFGISDSNHRKHSQRNRDTSWTFWLLGTSCSEIHRSFFSSSALWTTTRLIRIKCSIVDKYRDGNEDINETCYHDSDMGCLTTPGKVKIAGLTNEQSSDDRETLQVHVAALWFISQLLLYQFSLTSTHKNALTR